MGRIICAALSYFGRILCRGQSMKALWMFSCLLSSKSKRGCLQIFPYFLFSVLDKLVYRFSVLSFYPCHWIHSKQFRGHIIVLICLLQISQEKAILSQNILPLSYFECLNTTLVELTEVKSLSSRRLFLTSSTQSRVSFHVTASWCSAWESEKFFEIFHIHPIFRISFCTKIQWWLV